MPQPNILNPLRAFTIRYFCENRSKKPTYTGDPQNVITCKNLFLEYIE